MKVEQITWSEIRAVAFVGGVQVRVQHGKHHTTWRCDEHGIGLHPHCSHLQAFAGCEPDGAAYRRRTTAGDFKQGRRTT